MRGFSRALLWVSAIALFFTVTELRADSWNDANNPANFSNSYQYNVNALPTEGKLAPINIPWSETYWPSKQGSINMRWNSPKHEGFNYHSPTREEVASMTKEQLAQLAPSEKYDLFMGNYDYPLKEDVKRIATRTAKWWSGICHGWSPAAIQFKEPQPVEMKNPDGIVIPFGASDVKGLMSYAAAMYNDLDPVQVGTKCNPAGWVFQTAACQDINPGALHVILANQLGIHKEGFVVQREPRGQIWNQPVYGYKFEMVGSAEPNNKDAASGVEVHATMLYTDELDESLWTPVTGTKDFVEGKMEMSYVLDLDSQGNIIGGSWNDRNHPDFVWKPRKKIEFTGIMDGVNRLYHPITKN